VERYASEYAAALSGDNFGAEEGHAGGVSHLSRGHLDAANLALMFMLQPQMLHSTASPHRLTCWHALQQHNRSWYSLLLSNWPLDRKISLKVFTSDNELLALRRNE
jgi:hypothetical protein